jgi:hypothetical protein
VHPDLVQDQPGASAGTVTVGQSRAQRDGLFGGGVAVAALALGRGVAGAQTTGGRLAVAVIFGALIVLLAWAWVRVTRRPDHLEISSQAITHVSWRGQTVTLARQQGDVLRFVKTGGGRTWAGQRAFPGLTSRATGVVLSLNGFSTGKVRQACAAAGWQFE